MKILFIKPKTEQVNKSPPTSFVALAGELRNYDVRILDGQCYGYDDKHISRYVKEYNPDIIGFGGMTNEIRFSYDLAEKVRKISGAKIVFGGAHATFEPEEVLSKYFVDFIFRGEAEIPFAEFVNKLEKNEDCRKVSNLGYKNKGKLIFNDTKWHDFNALEMPDWDLIKLKDYRKASINKKFPSAPIVTTRGCPFKCTFCAGFVMMGRRYRMRNLNKIIDELKYLKKTQGIKEFLIFDDNFGLIKKRVMEFCDLLIKEKLDLVWSCANGIRIDTLDEEVILKMKEAGCFMINLPIEFGTQKMLDIIKKGSNLEKMKKIAPLVEKNGLKATLYFIIGHPEETIEDIKKTIKLSLQIPASRAFFSIHTLFPGTEDYYKYKDKERWEGGKEIERIWRKAVFRFYFRPKQLFILIKDNFFNRQQLVEFIIKLKKIVLGEDVYLK